MEKPSRTAHSHLFTVRVWQEDLGDGQAEWRGWVKNVASGEERYFRTWPTLGEVLQGMTVALVAGASTPDAVHRVVETAAP